MITLNQIQKQFGATLRKHKVMNKWIDVILCQSYISKALKYSLTDNEINELYKIGNWKGTYPGLYYLCTIYIHPVTYLQGILQKELHY